MDQEQENYEYSGRAAPQAVEAEVFFLGGVMQDPNVLSDVVSLLDPEDFFQERHKIIWEALQRLSQFNTPIDVVTLSNALETENKLEAAGGREYEADRIRGERRECSLPCRNHSEKGGDAPPD